MDNYDTFRFILHILFIFLMVLGSLLIFLAIYVTKQHQFPSGLLIGNLALTDLLIAAFLFPFGIPAIFFGGWSSGRELCVLNGFTNQCLSSVAILTLSAISLDRYVAIIHGVRYHQIMTLKRVGLIIVTIWAFGILCSIFPLLGWGRYIYQHGASLCVTDFKTNKFFTFFIFTVFFCIPLNVIFFIYFRIYKAVRRHAKAIRSNSIHPTNEKAYELGDKHEAQTNHVAVPSTNESGVRQTNEATDQLPNESKVEITNLKANQLTSESKVHETYQLDVQLTNEIEVANNQAARHSTNEDAVEETNQMGDKLTNDDQAKVTNHIVTQSTNENAVGITNPKEKQWANEQEFQSTVQSTNKNAVRITNQREKQGINEHESQSTVQSTNENVVQKTNQREQQWANEQEFQSTVQSTNDKEEQPTMLQTLANHRDVSSTNYENAHENPAFRPSTNHSEAKARIANQKKRHKPIETTLQRTKSFHAKLKKETKAALTMLGIISVHVLSLTPFAVYNLYCLHTGYSDETADFVTSKIAYSNAFFNPLIYGLMNKIFRQGFYQIFYAIFRCKKRPNGLERSRFSKKTSLSKYNG